MKANQTLLIALAIVSATLMLLLALLTNLVSAYIADSLKPYAPWILIALGLVFVVSLGVLIWQMRAERRSGGAGPSVEQRARRRGRIVKSPIKVPKNSNASVSQTAEDNGVIEESGITID